MDLLSEIKDSVAIIRSSFLDLDKKLEQLHVVLKDNQVESSIIDTFFGELTELTQPTQKDCKCLPDLNQRLIEDKRLSCSEFEDYFCGNNINQIQKCSNFFKLVKIYPILQNLDLKENVPYFDGPFDSKYNDGDFSASFITNILDTILFINGKAAIDSQERIIMVVIIYNFLLQHQNFMADEPLLRFGFSKKWHVMISGPKFINYLETNVPSRLEWHKTFTKNYSWDAVYNRIPGFVN